MEKYDFIIVGAGFFGATCARLLTDNGFKCLIIEKEKYVGGLAASYELNGIEIHRYGAHVIHTDDFEVWDFLSRYCRMFDYKLNVKVQSKNEYYQLPLNLNIINKTNKINTPKEAIKQIEDDRKDYGVVYRRNLEEELVYRIGFKPYMMALKGYYEKMFGIECKHLSTAYLRDVRNDMTYNTNYYSNLLCGIPDCGYTKLVENIIGDDIDIMFGVDFIKNKDKFINPDSIIISSTPIDKFCNYVYGPLDWATLDFELKDMSKETNNFIGMPVLRINDPDNMMVELIEHKWLNIPKNGDGFNNHTYVSYVFHGEWTPEKECMFAINSDKSEDVLNRYIEFVNKTYPNVIFGGRQGLYRNISIADTIRLAMDLINDILEAKRSS